MMSATARRTVAQCAERQNRKHESSLGDVPEREGVVYEFVLLST